MTTTFALVCYLRGDDYTRVLEVKIGGEESVAALKEAIKEKTRPDFDDIRADSLVLWKVSVPFNPSLPEDVERLNLIVENSLQPLDILQDVFPSGLVRKSVHIVVDRPLAGEFPTPTWQCIPTFVVSRLAESRQLNCLVCGDPVGRIFTIEIAANKNVAALKKAIKEEKHAFAQVDADAIEIWKISIRGDKDNLEQLAIPAFDPLSPLQKLSEVFTSLSPTHVHVLVKEPPVGEHEPYFVP